MMIRPWKAVVFGLCLAVCGSCAAVPDPDQPAPAAPPDRGQFVDGGVNDFMEKRCGSLDCHGQIGRPLRLYSATGLRKTKPLEKFLDRPEGGTTPDEKSDNYLAVVYLEPEAIGLSHATDGAYRDFLLLKKPVGLPLGPDGYDGDGVRHKGGPVLRETGDPGYNCLVSWIRGAVATPDCVAATF